MCRQVVHCPAVRRVFLSELTEKIDVAGERRIIGGSIRVRRVPPLAQGRRDLARLRLARLVLASCGIIPIRKTQSIFHQADHQRFLHALQRMAQCN